MMVALSNARRSANVVRSIVVALLGLGAATAACSSGGGGKLHDASADFVIDYQFGELPPGCPPAAANDKGIGKACSKGGRECGGTQICTCDTFLGVVPPPSTPCFCTVPILNADPSKQPCDTVPAGTCGQNAVCCAYQTVGAICVPAACLESATCPNFGP